MKRLLFAILLVMSLAACSNDASNTDNSPSPNTEANTASNEAETSNESDTSSQDVEEEIFFTASVTGDIAREFEDIATLTCTDGNGSNIPRHQILTMNDDDTKSTIALSMPALSDTGTYPLVGQTVENYGEAFAIEVFFDRSITFNVVDEGTVTFEALAKGPGEPIKGNLQATMTSEDGDQTINLSADFDFSSITTEDMEKLGYEYSFLYCSQEN